MLWSELHDLLKYRHILPGDDALDSVNRLLDKNEKVKDTLGRLQLRRGRTSITLERWELTRLVEVLHPSQQTDDEPTLPTGAVAVVRDGALEFLVDGRRRVNHWIRNGTIGPHRVLVVAEVPQ